MNAVKQLFDDWPERYDQWFETPVGRAVLKYETKLILDLLQPMQGGEDPGRRLRDGDLYP